MQLTNRIPQFVIVMGGAGSGKNHFIENHSVLSKFQLVDVDAIKGALGLSAAISAIKPLLLTAFSKQLNVAHPTTGSNLQAQKNKIDAAHQHGYTVTLILVDTPIKQAIAQVQKRADKGGHNVELDAIVASNKKARINFEALKSFADTAQIV